jgi:hypothetical protein
VLTCGKFEYSGPESFSRPASFAALKSMDGPPGIERSLSWLAQFVARTLEPAPELWIVFTKRNGRFVHSAFFLLKIPPNIGLMV